MIGTGGGDVGMVSYSVGDGDGTGNDRKCHCQTVHDKAQKALLSRYFWMALLCRVRQTNVGANNCASTIKIINIKPYNIAGNVHHCCCNHLW